ncbi:hypothetical protein [Jeotgalibaca porci]|uniref:hypothetical protein n=1 Tax=Jeotgalibaca porci TaxID=1868793 RepID=UPI0035A15928
MERKRLGDLSDTQIAYIKKQYLAFETWPEIAEALGFKRNQYKALALKCYRADWWNEVKKERVQLTEKLGVPHIVKMKADEGKLYSEDELLALHGLDPDQFRIVTGDSNHWTVNTKEEEKLNMQHKIKWKPKDQVLTPQDIVDIIGTIEPTEVEMLVDEIPQQYLLIPLFDMHFGPNTYDSYSQLLKRIVDIVQNTYEEILIIVGGDYLHVDNLNNTTAKGTQLEDMDFPQMVKDGVQFLKDIIKVCLVNSPNVRLSFLPGNHAPSNDYILTWGVSESFQDLEADVELDHFKQAWLGPHSIFMHHGDKIKNGKRLLEVMVSKFAKEWGQSTSRYLITGHKHHELPLAFGGLTHYQVMSPSDLGDYDKDNGYIDSESGLMLLEFDVNRRTAIYYLE